MTRALAFENCYLHWSPPRLRISPWNHSDLTPRRTQARLSGWTMHRIICISSRLSNSGPVHTPLGDPCHCCLLLHWCHEGGHEVNPWRGLKKLLGVGWPRYGLHHQRVFVVNYRSQQLVKAWPLFVESNHLTIQLQSFPYYIKIFSDYAWAP